MEFLKRIIEGKHFVDRDILDWNEDFKCSCRDKGLKPTD